MKLQYWVWLGSMGLAALAVQACGSDSSSSGSAGSGGKASGGANTGGNSGNTGGKATGGTSAGGTSAGGTSAGGTSAGGTSAGGGAGTGTGGVGNGGASGMAGVGNQAGAAGAGQPGSKAEAQVVHIADGETITGTANFQLLGNGDVKLKLTVTNCPVGVHNVHLHVGNACSAPGLHWVPNGEIITAITCDAQMMGSLNFTAPAASWEVNTDTMNDVSKYLIVIHAINQGPAIACGEVNPL